MTVGGAVTIDQAAAAGASHARRAGGLMGTSVWAASVGPRTYTLHDRQRRQHTEKKN